MEEEKINTEKAIRNYADLIRSDVFAKYEKDFAEGISSELSRGYLKKLDEPGLVKILENVVNGVHGPDVKDPKTHFELSTRSIFIHGNKSQVEFDYYGQNTKRELGDLIFIISIVFKGKKYFEKLTITQFKKFAEKSTWNLLKEKDKNGKYPDKEQLYLLSRFPTFRGVRGFIPKGEHALPNYSGCLGSYGLLYKPGDFAFVSATELDSFIGHRDSLKMDELYNLAWGTEKYSFPYPPELLYLDNCRAHAPWWRLPWNLFGNYHHAYNTFDFTHKYLTMGIGEPTFMEGGMYNLQAKSFLHDLLSVLKNRAKKDGKKGGPVDNFTDRFFRSGYADKKEGGFRDGIEVDVEGRGMGIIHTIINLGE